MPLASDLAKLKTSFGVFIPNPETTGNGVFALTLKICLLTVFKSADLWPEIPSTFTLYINPLAFFTISTIL